MKSRWANEDSLMQYSWHQIEFATCAVHFLPVVAGVALIAFAAKSRIVFVVGGVGALLGWGLTGSVLPLGRSTGGRLDRQP